MPTFLALPLGVERASFLLVRSLVCLVTMNSFLLTLPPHSLGIALKGLLAALAAILALEPSVLILDEPTNGLDPAWRRHLAQVLFDLPVQVLWIASHDLHWVGKVTQRALVLSQGRIQVDTEIQPLLQEGNTLDQLGLPVDW